MKKLLVMAGLLFTLSNVGIGIAYACECYVHGELVCTGKICTGDGQTCSCSGNEMEAD